MDKDRLIRIMEHCSTTEDCSRCEYETDCYGGERLPGVPLIRDALELLKERDAAAQQISMKDIWRNEK